MHHTEVCAKRVTFLFVCSVCHLTFVSKRGAGDEAAKLASCAPGFVQHFRKTPQDIFQETSGQFPAVLAVTITKTCMGNPIQSRSWRQNWSLTLGHFQPCLWWPKQAFQTKALCDSVVTRVKLKIETKEMESCNIKKCIIWIYLWFCRNLPTFIIDRFIDVPHRHDPSMTV